MGVGRRFGASWALRGVDLEVRPGEILAVVGANGSGKSTLLLALAGLLRPTEGRVEIDGTPVGALAARARGRLGLLPSFSPLFDRLTLRHNARHAGRLRRMAPHDVDTRLDELGAALRLDERLDVPVESLSAGAAQRAAIALTLLHAPAVVLLDEPLRGLDADGIEDVGALLSRLAALGAALVSTAHAVAEIAAIATSVARLERGEIVARGAVGDLVDDAPSGESRRRAPALAWYDAR